MTETDVLVARVRRRMFIFAAIEIGASFLFGWRAGVSLTIAAAVVIFSFLVFEKLTERLVPQPERKNPVRTMRTLVPLLLVTAVSLVVFGIVLFRWKGFEPIAGAVGLSTVVLAIVPETWMGRRPE